jgi:anti-sigma-K factor RskA
MTDYVLGHLSPDEAERFEHVLETNPDLKQDVDRLRDVLNLMPHALPNVDPPPHLRSAILDAAQASSDRSVSTVSSSRPVLRVVRQRSPLTWISLGSAAAAILLAVNLAVENYRLRQDLKEAQVISQMLQQPNTAIHTLTGVENAANGRIAINPEQGQVLLAIHNLPEPPSGKTYRLWAVAGQSVTYCGQFETNANGETQAQLTLPSTIPNLDASELRITLESASAPFSPEGPLVMKSGL